MSDYQMWIGLGPRHRCRRRLRAMAGIDGHSRCWNKDGWLFFLGDTRKGKKRINTTNSGRHGGGVKTKAATTRTREQEKRKNKRFVCLNQKKIFHILCPISLSLSLSLSHCLSCLHFTQTHSLTLILYLSLFHSFSLILFSLVSVNCDSEESQKSFS